MHTTQIIGRDVELAQIATQWAYAAAGQAGIMVLAGDPGMGKSSLQAAHRPRSV